MRIVLPVLLVSCAPTVQERIDGWAEDQDLAFEDCGTSTCDPTDPATGAARDCIAAAQDACTPALVRSIDPGDGFVYVSTLFVVPTTDGCEVHYLIDGSAGPGEDLTHYRCDGVNTVQLCLAVGGHCERVPGP